MYMYIYIYIYEIYSTYLVSSCPVLFCLHICIRIKFREKFHNLLTQHFRMFQRSQIKFYILNKDRERERENFNAVLYSDN